MLTRDLNVGLGSLGIEVNAIAPGAIITKINHDLLHHLAPLDALTGQISFGPARQAGGRRWPASVSGIR
ncbi:hypothetical protein ETAA8_37740 [Anatilimnocola aggregata]|uniref:Uncharacterized protein n=2 Tax=Anatilimnocola aggregata TaxID=2528021 RepID=A0A517YEP1_9BACT|nr:hypothetical protein ETAA8_37740 [Anatilimnocola aggregata]